MKKKFLLVGVLLIIVLAVSMGCGKDQAESIHNDGGFTSYTQTSPPSYPMPTVTTTMTAGGKGYAEDSYETGYSSATSTIDRMIVRTGNMTIVVENVGLSIDQVGIMAETYDGWVVNSNTWQDNQRIYGNISIRVAAERFDAAIAALRAMAVEVRAENTSGQDVTEEYYDLDAQLVTLKASEDQLLELMERAGSVEEILEVQRELTSTQTKIAQIEGRMEFLRQSSDTSLITVNMEESRLGVEFTASRRNAKEGEEIQFRPEVSGGFTPYTYAWDFGDGETSNNEWPLHEYKDSGTYTVSLNITDDKGNTAETVREEYITVETGWSAGSIAGSAASGLATFGRGLLNALIWIGIFSPVWIVIGVVIFLVVRRKRRKA